MNFKSLRIEKRMNIPELSRAITENCQHISPEHDNYKTEAHRIEQIIRRIEKGAMPNSPEIIKYYCEFFSVTSDYLLGLTGTKNEKAEPDTAIATKKTGLSETAIESLHDLLRREETDTLYIIDKFITSEAPTGIKHAITNYYDTFFKSTTEKRLNDLDRKELLHSLIDDVFSIIESDKNNPIKRRYLDIRIIDGLSTLQEQADRSNDTEKAAQIRKLVARCLKLFKADNYKFELKKQADKQGIDLTEYEKNLIEQIEFCCQPLI